MRPAPTTSARFRAARTLLTISISLPLLTGCADRITGPEALEIARAIERTYSVDGELDGPFLHLMGGWWLEPFRKAAGQIPTVVASRDRRSVRYQALVFEKMMDPPTGFLPKDGCVATRRSLLLWREGEYEALVLTGGDFSQRIVRRPEWCSMVNGGLFGPEPVAWIGRWVHLEDGERGWQHWESEDGRGDISSGVVAGDCAFLDAAGARYLLDEMGATCKVTRHRVRFDIGMGDGETTRRTEDGGKLRFPGPPGFSIKLPTVEVLGVRFTYDCSLEAAAAPCYRPLVWPPTEDENLPEHPRRDD